MVPLIIISSVMFSLIIGFISHKFMKRFREQKIHGFHPIPVSVPEPPPPPRPPTSAPYMNVIKENTYVNIPVSYFILFNNNVMLYLKGAISEFAKPPSLI